MGLLIDSSSLLNFAADPRGMLPPEMQAEEEFYLSVITADELLRSVSWATGRERARRLAFVEAVLDKFPILPIDRPTVRMHAAIVAGLERRKIRIGLHESWIAATCLTHGLRLLSGNPEDFAGVEGLELFKPAA